MVKGEGLENIKPLISKETFRYQTYDLGRFMKGIDEESLEECCIIIHGL
jgi:hypothetical protein